MNTYKCHMYALDEKSKRRNKKVRYIKALNAKQARKKWAETQIGSFELVMIEKVEGEK